MSALAPTLEAQLISRVLAIDTKRGDHSIVTYLTPDEAETLLAAPTPRHVSGGVTAPCYRWRSKPACGHPSSSAYADETCT